MPQDIPRRILTARVFSDIINKAVFCRKRKGEFMNTLLQLCGGYFDMMENRCDNGGEIPKNEMTCFRKATEAFLKSGKKADAFVVYFCFSEIFKLFGSGYENTQKLLETLSDHEYHSGELLFKHRDHYSHSVYVFALGLAMYAHDGKLRSAFDNFYKVTGGEAAEKFLRLWGTVSLFHDVGYPFQLAHEQLKVYAGELWEGGEKPYVSFGNMDGFLKLDDATGKRIRESLKADRTFSSVNELLSYGLQKREGYDFDYVCGKLKTRVERQPKFMDHGYFSAVILAKSLFENDGLVLDAERLDVLTAILLHNSLNKYEIENAHPIELNEHPLAYLLILCDELQNWDRLAYGKASKCDPIAWDVELTVSDDYISARYIFESYSVDDYSDGFLKKRPNKSFNDIQDGDFVKAIKSFIKSDLRLDASAAERTKKKKSYLYASEDNFINLCDFAKAIHASYIKHCLDYNIDHLNCSFAELPLEYKVSNIEQAKSYSYKLELINCFYSSKNLDYPVVDDFNDCRLGNRGARNVEFLAREEHLRWVREKLNLGWRYGTDYKTAEERNCKKIHKSIVPYEALSESEKSKDVLMIRNIIPLLKKFNSGIKIYNYRSGRKEDLVIAGTGHRYFTEDTDPATRNLIKEKIKAILKKYAEEYRVIVRTCYANGADILIAECADELNLTTKAVLPMEYEQHIRDVIGDRQTHGNPMTENEVLHLRHLLALAVVCKVVPDPVYTYYESGKYLIEKCDRLIAVWDGKELPLHDRDNNPINRGGTYHCIDIARKRGLKDNETIHFIDCFR